MASRRAYSALPELNGDMPVAIDEFEISVHSIWTETCHLFTQAMLLTATLVSRVRHQTLVNLQCLSCSAALHKLCYFGSMHAFAIVSSSDVHLLER